MRISDWSSDVCSSDLQELEILGIEPHAFDRLGRAEADVGLAAVDEVLHLDLHIGAALAGLGVLNLDRAPDAAFIFENVAGTDVHAADLHGPTCWKERRAPADARVPSPLPARAAASKQPIGGAEGRAVRSGPPFGPHVDFASS